MMAWWLQFLKGLIHCGCMWDNWCLPVCFTTLWEKAGSVWYFDINNICLGDFLGGPVVKDPLSNAEDSNSIPGQGTTIPQASGQLNLLVLTTEPEFPNKDPSPPKRKKYIFGLFPTFLAQNCMNPLKFSWVIERNVFCYSLQTPFNYTWVYANEVTQWFTG